MTTLEVDQCQLNDTQFHEISSLVKTLCGINLHDGKRELVKARLSKRIRQLGMASFSDYIGYVRSAENPRELTAMLDSLSTNLTHFFREQAHFDYLADVLLPARLEAMRKTSVDAARTDPQQPPLKIWSAGCSSGEEPYSIAMALADAAPLRPAMAKILATDLCTQVLAKARRGVYDAHRLRDVPQALRNSYFEKLTAGPAGQYRIRETIRANIVFARLNLMEPWPMSGSFDAIFCRNVMIYFDKLTQARLIDRFWKALCPGGVLMVGHSESLSGIAHRYKYVQPAVYQKP